MQAPAGDLVVSLPGTTSAFAAANIFARASGYVDQRNVDIGDRVKAGQLLATIVAPELDHQIAQAEATLAQLRSTLQQRKAARELARVTWDRDKPVVRRAGCRCSRAPSTSRRSAAGSHGQGGAQATSSPRKRRSSVLHQQKIYQSVVAPFDGVITQRNIDIGSLVQADATTGTFMFTIIQDNVIRTQVFVPQDAAFGVQPGVQAVVHVPEMPDRSFPAR